MISDTALMFKPPRLYRGRAKAVWIPNGCIPGLERLTMEGLAVWTRLNRYSSSRNS
jgi:hypothetical protein